jgi:hypothetical protein
MNPDYEVVCALHALARAHRARLRRALPTWRGRPQPAAFWIRRTG